MTAVMFTLGQTHSVPLSENAARSTVEPIRSDSKTAELTKAPDWNEQDFDSTGELVGLSPRVVGSATTDSEQYSPWWASLVSDANHNRIIDDQVSSSGTAAKREMAGQFGHGTMQTEIGIEPVIRDGGAFGSQTFVSDYLHANEGSGAYMTPPDQDNWAQSLVQAQSESASRQAFLSTQYKAMLAGAN